MPISSPFNVLSGGGDISEAGTPAVGGPASQGSTDNALVRWDGTSGLLVQNGIVTEGDDGEMDGPLYRSSSAQTGVAFTNQPANDGVEVLSANAGDTTQTVTIIGTTNGVDTVVVETVTLNGTTPVSTVKTNWGVILAVTKSATTLGTVTVREASGDLTITAGLTAAVLSVGAPAITAFSAYNKQVSLVGSGTTTKQVGLQGTDSTGAVIYDSQALTDTTSVLSNSVFKTITAVYVGDLEVTRTVLVANDATWLFYADNIELRSPTANQGLKLTPNGTGVVAVGGTSPTIQAVTNTTLTLATLDNNKNIVITPHGTGATNFSVGEIQTGGNRVNYNLSAYGAGTAYVLTNTAAAIDFGTTDPVIVLNKVGTYLISGQVNLAYNAATVVAETASIKVRRTNNTAADLSAVVLLDLPVATTLTYTYGVFPIPPFTYTTAATDDSVTLFANVSATLGAGAINATAIGTSIVAVRLY